MNAHTRNGNNTQWSPPEYISHKLTIKAIEIQVSNRCNTHLGKMAKIMCILQKITAITLVHITNVI